MHQVTIVQSNDGWTYEDKDGPIVSIRRGSYKDHCEENLVEKDEPSYSIRFLRFWTSDRHYIIVPTFEKAMNLAEKMVKIHYETVNSENELLHERYKKKGDDYKATL